MRDLRGNADLKPVTLQPAGVVSIDFQKALRAAGPAAAGHASSYGMAGVKYKWSWSAVLATIYTVDTVQSLSYRSVLGADAQVVHDPASLKTNRAVEGMWWAPHSRVDGFIALANTNQLETTAQVAFSDAQNHPIAQQSVAVPAHGTKLLSLSELLGSVKDVDATGSVSIRYKGVANSLLVNEGIEDGKVGYSASPQFRELSLDTVTTAEPSTLVQLAAPGSLIGKPDPAKLFPEKTVFTPYAYLHNTSAELLSVDVLYSPLQGGSPTKIGTVAVAPHGTTQADVAGMLQQHQLAPEGGVATLVFAYQGRSGQVDIETGSIDQTRNYVFGVSVVGEQSSISKTLCYWTTNIDYDSAIAILNFTDTPSDGLLTFYFTGGTYKLPVHLVPGETKTFDLRAIQSSQVPDADGHVLSINATEGSAILSSAAGEIEPMSVAIATTSFSVKNATCGLTCSTCNGISSFSLSPNPLGLAVQQQSQMQGIETYNTQSTQTTTSGSWNVGASTIASLSNTGIVTGVSSGQTTANFSITNASIYVANMCSSGGTPICPAPTQFGASSPIAIAPTISQDHALWFFGLGNTPPSSFTLGNITATLTANGAFNGTYNWTITAGTSIVNFQNGSTTYTSTNNSTAIIVSTGYSHNYNDVTISLKYTPSGEGVVPSATHSLYVDSPYRLTSTGSTATKGVTSSCINPVIGTAGFQSLVPYRNLSLFGVVISNIGLNEAFAGQSDDLAGTSWPPYAAGGYVTSDGTFVDNICAINQKNPTSLPPQNPLSTTKIDHTNQFWFIGSINSGSGVQVQSNILQRYQDHGVHVSITSPTR